MPYNHSWNYGFSLKYIPLDLTAANKYLNRAMFTIQINELTMRSKALILL